MAKAFSGPEAFVDFPASWRNKDGLNLFLVLHLSTIVPALILGPFILFRRKGDSIHKGFGRLWAILTLFIGGWVWGWFR